MLHENSGLVGRVQRRAEADDRICAATRAVASRETYGAALGYDPARANGVPNEVPDSAEVTPTGIHSTGRIWRYRAKPAPDRATHDWKG